MVESLQRQLGQAWKRDVGMTPGKQLTRVRSAGRMVMPSKRELPVSFKRKAGSSPGLTQAWKSPFQPAVVAVTPGKLQWRTVTSSLTPAAQVLGRVMAQAGWRRKFGTVQQLPPSRLPRPGLESCWA